MINAQHIKSLRNNKPVSSTDIMDVRRRKKEEEANRIIAEKKRNATNNRALPTIPETNKYESYLQLPDFPEKSGSAGKKPDYWFKRFNDTIFDWGQFKDKDYSSIEIIKNSPGYYEAYEMQKDLPNYVVEPDSSLNRDEREAVSKMTENEIGIYNYLFNTEGKSKADEYLNEYVKSYTSSKAQQRDIENQEFAEEHPVLGSLYSVMSTVAKPEGLLYSLNQKRLGKDIDPNSNLFDASRTQNTIRSTVKENENMSGAGGFLYDTGMSVLDSLFAAPLGPTTGALMLSGGAGADTIKDAKERGGTDKQALLTGLTSAVAEGLFERISLGNLKSLQQVPINNVKDVAFNVLKSTGVNASEELATEITNQISDYVVMGDISNYNMIKNSYMQKGMSEEAADRLAKKEIAKQIGLAALGGALAGGAMSSGAIGLNVASASLGNSKSGETDITEQEKGVNSDLYNAALELETQKQETKNYQPGNNIKELTVQPSEAKSEFSENLTEPEINESTPEVNVLAKNYKSNGEKAFVSNYNSELPIDTYNKAFSTYYDAGIVNQPVEKIESAYGSLIPETVRMNAYYAGVNDAQAIKTTPVNKNKVFGVVESEAAKKMDDGVRAALNELGKISKTEIRIEETIAEGLANGMYKDGTLYIALDSDNPYMTVAKHELTHSIQQSSPELYKKYKDFVISEINRNNPKAYNDMVDRLISRYSEIGETITRDEAMDEIVADASEMFLTDPEIIGRLSSKDKSVADKVIEFIKELITRIQTALSNVEANTKAAKALNENLDIAKEAERLWVEALSDASSNTSDDVKSIRYQLKDVDYTEYNRAIQENKKLKEINTLLNEQFKLTKELKPNINQLERAARDILKKTSSSYDKETLVENLENIWRFIHTRSEIMYTEEVVEATKGMAIMIMKKSQAIDNSLVENSKEMLEEIKKTPLILAPRDRADLASEGGFNNFRKKYIGKIRLVAENGIAVDTFYQRLSEAYPEYFSEDITHPADQLIKIAEIVDFIKPIYHNPYGMNIDEAARDLAYDIISTAYFDIRQAPKTFADRKKIELEKTRLKYNKKVRELHDEYRTKYNERLAEIKQQNDSKVTELMEKVKTVKEEEKVKFQEQIKKLRDQNIQKLKAQQQRFAERMDMARARRERTIEANKYKDRIKKIAKELSDMLLKPTDKKHLPGGFRNAVKEVCQILDFETGTLGPKGEPTMAALKWRKLKDAYADLKDDENSIAGGMYFENIETDIRELTDIVEGKRVNQLNFEELQKVHEIMKHIKHIINQENKLFAENIKDSTSAIGETIISQLNQVKKYSQSGLVAKSSILEPFTDMLNKGNIKPYYFFKKIGGELERLYKNVRDGEDKFVQNFEKGNEYAHDIEKKYDYFSWVNDKSEEFATSSGTKISLSIGEKLYIYAASRRKQGLKHILKGGVVTEEPKVTTEESKGKKIIKEVVYQADPVQFTEMDIKNLANSLTEEQRGFVEEMVEYLSKDLSVLGNDVTRQLFGLDAYMEENYIPLTSDRSFLYTKAGVTDDKRIKRMAFTKPLTQNASNPIIATDFMKVWGKHLVDMSMYNALVLPLEDFQRVWNYKQKAKTGEEFSVKNAIKKAYGPKANEYIEKLITDINGGIRQDVGGKLSNILLSKMKIDAVMGNLSVAIQQPSSLARAFVIINPKYFVKTAFSKRDYNELLKYSPQAKLKQYGYFDVNMGRNLSDVVTEQEYEGPIEKIKAFFTDKNVRNEVFSWLPQKMDEITWSHIWNAVKEETKAETDLKEGTEAFYNRAKERFKEVIDRSQVMDSVFQRSELMRSQNPFAKIATNFMGEPTVSYNMLYDAISEYKKNGAKTNPYVIRSISAVVSGMVLNALLKSIITAARDKDEEKTYGEKYLESVVRNISDDPLSMIPYVNSVASIFKGYNASRPDMQVFQNLYYAWSKLDSDKYTPSQKTLQLAQAIAPFVNVPLKNISRDIEMIWRNGADLLESMGILEGMTDYEKLRVKYPTVDSSTASSKYYDLLYKAHTEGNNELYRQIYNDLIKSGKKPSNIEDAIKNRTMDELKSNPLVLEAVTAKENKDTKVYQSIQKKLVNEGYTPKEVKSAIESLEKERMRENAPTSEEFIEAYRTGDKTIWKPIYDKMKASGWMHDDLMKLIR